MTFRGFFCTFLLVFACSSGAHAASTDVMGMDLLKGTQATIKPGLKGTVVVFMSAKCPCSNSHVDTLKGLAKDFAKDFNFVAVHSNIDESLEISRDYFKAAELPFIVLQDEKTRLADFFKANKTPHAFLVAPNGEVIYKGGVTNSKNAASADVQYLRDALTDVQAERKVRTPEGRALGCMISRGEKFVW